MSELLSSSLLGMPIGMWLIAVALGIWSGLLIAASMNPDLGELEIPALRCLDKILYRLFAADRASAEVDEEPDAETGKDENNEEEGGVALDQGDEPNRRSEPG